MYDVPQYQVEKRRGDFGIKQFCAYYTTKKEVLVSLLGKLGLLFLG